MSANRKIMIQGTGSNVGKSVITAALCRILSNKGFKVAPFKAQNMALNSFVTLDGLEIGRAQAMQAEASKTLPTVEMNPVLIKPQSDIGAQLIVNGKVFKNVSATGFQGEKKELKKIVKDSFDKLSNDFDVVVIEGAGSPAEINLQKDDIANMGTADLVDAPVVLVGDIDKGGVFASFVGTLELLEPHHRDRVKGFIINKFRGDISLLEDGLKFLEEKTGKPVLGVIPYFRDVYLEEEDSVNFESYDNKQKESGQIDVAVIYLPHISNFTDFDVLRVNEKINLRFIKSGEVIGSTDLIIIPGSKSVVEDLRYLKTSGLASEIFKHVKNMGNVFGICGGYQMLGILISDPFNVEGGGTEEGLGLLNMETVLNREKELCQSEGLCLLEQSIKVKGYEIHNGESKASSGKPLFDVSGKADGLVSEDSLVWGTYLHGIFDNKKFVEFYFKKILDVDITIDDSHALKEEGFNKLASVVEESLDMEKVFKIIGEEVTFNG